MKTSIGFLAALLLTIGMGLESHASVTVDTLTVQGYMKKANGAAVSNGSYNIAFGVMKGGTAIWAKQVSTTVTSGLFSITLSGAGSNLSALGAGTGLNADYTGVNLSSTLLEGTGSGAVTIRAYAVSAIDGNNPQFDIQYASVPTAFVADTAKSVVAGGVTVAAIASASKTNSSAGAADAGKIVLLDSNGLVAANMLPSTGVSGSSISTGTVATARLDAVNASTGVTEAGKVAILDSNGKLDSSLISVLPATVTGPAASNMTVASVAGQTTNVGDNTTTSATAIRSGTGGITIGVTGTTGNVAITAGSTSGNIALTPGSSGNVQLPAAGVLTTSSGALTVKATAGSTTTIGENGTAGSAVVLSGGSTGGITVGTGNTALTNGIVKCSVAASNASTFNVTGCTGIPATGTGWVCSCQLNNAVASSAPAAATTLVTYAKPGFSALATATAGSVFVTLNAALTTSTNTTVGCICMK